MTAQLAIILLFVNGAANQSTPNSITVAVKCKTTNTTTSKNDLKYAYSLVTKNDYLRRLAEALGPVIAEYCFRNGLKGVLL